MDQIFEQWTRSTTFIEKEIAMNTMRLRLLVATSLAAFIFGCGGGGGGSGGAATGAAAGGGSGTGSLTVGVSDAPVDSARRVVVEFLGVELKPEEGDAFEIMYDAPRQIDLLNLTGDESELLLNEEEVEAGRYNWIRLILGADEGTTNSFIELDDGTIHPLAVPSGDQTGLKLVSGFEVPEDGSADFTIDFDLRKSVRHPPGQGDEYKLRPALRLIDNSEAARLAGMVDAQNCNGDPEGSAVYVFAGHGVVPDDIDDEEDMDGEATGPAETAIVSLNPDSGQFEYRTDPMEPGDYTAAFTCEPESDDPDTDDEILFQSATNVTLTAGATTTLDFGFDNAQAGRLAGVVADARCGGDLATGAIYVFAGAGVAPDDRDGVDPDPVAVAVIELDAEGSAHHYSATPLAPGDYTAALTCEAAGDAEGVDDAINFEGATDVVIFAGLTTLLDFP
jgi:hypothetical protein